MIRFAYFLPFILSVAILPLQIHAEPNGHFLRLAQNTQQGLNSAVQRIKKQTGGRILSAKTINNHGQTIYKIKVLLPSGKVRIFTVKQN